jgi:metal-responsive CopG/Arc/MetJ family transcriptional regulator
MMLYSLYVKSIQVTFDEKLLARLDASPEVRRDGRSAVLRKATAEYLARRRDSEIAEAYARGYGEQPVDDELEGWSEQGVWPEE